MTHLKTHSVIPTSQRLIKKLRLHLETTTQWVKINLLKKLNLLALLLDLITQCRLLKCIPSHRLNLHKEVLEVTRCQKTTMLPYQKHLVKMVQLNSNSLPQLEGPLDLTNWDSLLHLNSSRSRRHHPLVKGTIWEGQVSRLPLVAQQILINHSNIRLTSSLPLIL